MLRRCVDNDFLRNLTHPFQLKHALNLYPLVQAFPSPNLFALLLIMYDALISNESSWNLYTEVLARLPQTVVDSVEWGTIRTAEWAAFETEWSCWKKSE